VRKLQIRSLRRSLEDRRYRLWALHETKLYPRMVEFMCWLLANNLHNAQKPWDPNGPDAP